MTDPKPLSDAALARLEEQVALSKVQAPTRYREEERAGMQLLAAFPAIRSRLRLAEARVAELESALDGYAVHDQACMWNESDICSCGLNAARAAEEAGRAQDALAGPEEARG